MKKEKIGRVLLKIVVLVLVFAGAFVVSTRILNQENGTTSEAMENATLPLVYMLTDGTPYNTLHGYKNPMTVTATRDTLTPLNSDQTLDIQIVPYDNEIGDITFEVLSADGTGVFGKHKSHQNDRGK